MGKVGFWGLSILAHLLPAGILVYWGMMVFWDPAEDPAVEAPRPFSFRLVDPSPDADFAPAVDLTPPVEVPKPPEDFEREPQEPVEPVTIAPLVPSDRPAPVLDRPVRPRPEIVQKVVVQEAMPQVETETVASEIYNPPPEYPLAARRKRQEGAVVVEVQILEDGTCGGAQIVEDCGVAAFGRSALESVRQWKFQPATRNGKPVRSTQRIRFVFKLQQ